MHLEEVAGLVKGSLYGSKKFFVKRIRPPDEAKAGDLTFLFDCSKKTKAGAVIATKRIPRRNGIVVKDVKKAMYLLLKHVSRHTEKQGISPQALVSKKAKIASSCSVEPFAIIQKDCRIGAGTSVGAHCFIDENVAIGRHCQIHPHVVIHRGTRIGNYVVIESHTVIGKEGFGFVRQKGYKRIKHIGTTRIDDFVEIGGNVVIDRGTIGDTVIGEGTKIDNLVQIAHNVIIGKNCLLMGQVGIAGSVNIGDNVVLCGQVGVSDHVAIGENVIVYAKSAVLRSVPPNKIFSGNPAREHSTVLRALARLYKKSV